RVGTMSLACAAVDDVTGWCILAYNVLLVRAESSPRGLWVTIGGVLAFIALMLFVGKPLLAYFETSFRRDGWITENATAMMLVVCLVAALSTEWLGIHSLFGAFF